MKFENTDVYNFENAIRGMRLPMNSRAKSDSGYKIRVYSPDNIQMDKDKFIIGTNDLNLMQRLVKAGSPHDKFMRQIFVSVDITAPLYWWKEMDQYKVGTTTNSQSTMHKLATTPITLDCFETDDMNKSENLEVSFDWYGDGTLSTQHFFNEPQTFIRYLEGLRIKYLKTKDIRYWKELVRWLPESWLQTRTWTANYEVLRNIVHQREGHKLTEWKSFINWVHTLPYSKELIFLGE